MEHVVGQQDYAYEIGSMDQNINDQIGAMDLNQQYENTGTLDTDTLSMSGNSDAQTLAGGPLNCIAL